MPTRPQGWCPHCGKRKPCPDHTTPAQRGYDSAWAPRAADYLRHHPRCEECDAPATQVHHHPERAELVRRGVADPDADVYLHSLCHPHHARHTLHGG